LAGASSVPTVTTIIGASSVLKEVYNPKAVIPHAALLDQASAHCPIFPTAASRRSLGRVSVPVWPVTLSGRLPVKALVGHYPTNKLIGREHIPHQKPFPPTTMKQSVASGISHPFRQLSQSEGQITHVLLTRSPLEYPPKEAFPLDLHVLSTPPAFVLSQDQTLHRKHNEKPSPSQKTTTSNRQNHRSSTQKNPKTTTTKKAMTVTRIHTNQFIDKHTVEFSKIRRAPEDLHRR
jgi:hypothetical protein